jgi:tetratricopeptide (TPR) repeat protein
MKVVTTLLKLVLAVAVLCLGWMALKPLATASWPLDGFIQPWIERAATAGPFDRIGLGIVILLFGAACLLAAVPKSVKDRSPRKPAGPLFMDPEALPVSHAVAEPEIAADAPFPMIAGTAISAAADPEIQPVLHAVPEPAADPVPELEAETVAQPVLEAPAEPVSSPVINAETPPTDFLDELAAARQALMAAPSPSARSRLADLLKKEGDIAEGEGRLDHAITAYEESVELRRAVLAADDHSAREQRWLWTTLESLAECREDRGHRTRAAALYREGLEAGERATALAPGEAAYPAELETTRARLAALEAQLVV